MATRRESNRHSMGCRSSWKAADPAFLIKVPSGGIPPFPFSRVGLATGSAIAISFSSTILGVSNRSKAEWSRRSHHRSQTECPAHSRSCLQLRRWSVSQRHLRRQSFLDHRPAQTNVALQTSIASQGEELGAWLANCDMPTESGHRSESRSRSTTSVTMPF